MSHFPSIKHLSVLGLHGSQQLAVDFRPGLNIFHGKNGSGKTTMLHILANLFERDIERFCHITFHTIRLQMSGEGTVELRQIRHSDSGTTVEVFLDGAPCGEVNQGDVTPAPLQVALRDRLGGRPVYLPAFRSVLEAINRNVTKSGYPYPDEEYKRDLQRIVDMVQHENRQDSRRASNYYATARAEALAFKTTLCRRWFGPFVPLVRYPSLWEVSDELNDELQGAYLALSITDQKALSSVFVHVLEALLNGGVEPPAGEDVPQLLEKVKHHLEALEHQNTAVAESYKELGFLLGSHQQLPSSEAQVHGILKVYEKALADRARSQQKAFERLRTFQESVNRFLQEEGRTLVLDKHPARASAARSFRNTATWIELPGGRRGAFDALSSGERHVVTLLFSATHMSSTDGVVLIDEPELSLHVEWQRIILTELAKQAGDRQIVACTHAPEVASEHLDAYDRLATAAWVHQIGDEDSGDVDDATSEGA